MNVANCPICETAEHVHFEADPAMGLVWTGCCSGCFDADFEGGETGSYTSDSLQASGSSREECIAHWNELVEDARTCSKCGGCGSDNYGGRETHCTGPGSCGGTGLNPDYWTTEERERWEYAPRAEGWS